MGFFNIAQEKREWMKYRYASSAKKEKSNGLSKKRKGERRWLGLFSDKKC
jgi:hypothetical protein